MRDCFLLRPDEGAFPDDPDIRYCIVERTAPLRVGAMVCAIQRNGGFELGRYLGRSPGGWHIITTHGGQMLSEMNPAALHGVFPITWTGSTAPPDVLVAPDRTVLAGFSAELLALARRMNDAANNFISADL